MCLVCDVSVRQEVFQKRCFVFFLTFLQQFDFYLNIPALFTINIQSNRFTVTDTVYACYLVFLFIMYILILCIFVVYWSTHKTNTEMTQQKFHPSP